MFKRISLSKINESNWRNIQSGSIFQILMILYSMKKEITFTVKVVFAHVKHCQRESFFLRYE